MRFGDDLWTRVRRQRDNLPLDRALEPCAPVPNRAPDPQLGGRLGAYSLDEHLPRGSRFQLWLATPSSDDVVRALSSARRAPGKRRADADEQVVLKTAHMGHDRGRVEALVDGLRPALAVEHVGLAATFDAGLLGSFFYAATEHVRGRDLSQLLGGRCYQRPRSAGTAGAGTWPNTKLPLDLALHVGLEVCDALSQAHRQSGSCHGELCPWHIMVGFDGSVKVLNFGLIPIATRIKADGIAESWAPFRYKAPEQVAGAPGDARSDTYALGAVLHELIVGRPWIDGDADCGLLGAFSDLSTPSADGGFDDHVPVETREVLVQALQPAPADRFQTAKALGLGLMRALAAAALLPSREKLARHMWRTFQKAR